MATNAEKTQAFEQRFVEVLNHAALSLMASVGYRTGLFDTLEKVSPVTSAGLADAAGLQERYVREWLGAMVVAGVVTMDESGAYTLPPEHAARLTRTGAPNLAVYAQFIGMLGKVEDEIVNCFENGGGVPYEKFGHFHDVMAEDSAQSVVPIIESHILPLVPGLDERLERGIRVLDVGCGRALALNQMARRFPNSEFVGMDLSEDAIASARDEARRSNSRNIQFEQRDLSDFDESAEAQAYDFVTAFDAVHDQKRPKSLLAGIRKTLKPGGVFLMQDIRGSSRHDEDKNHPFATILYTLSCMHCMAVSLAQGGEGLGAMWGERKIREYLNVTGFSRVERHQLEPDVLNDYYVAHP